MIHDRHAPAEISVMLIVADLRAAVDWYTQALGATVLWNLGPVAGLEIAGAAFFLHDVDGTHSTEDSPDRLGVTSVRVELFVHDPAAVLHRAVTAGAVAGSAIQERQLPWGTQLQGAFRDPFGHNWLVGNRTPLEGSEAAP